MHYIRCSRCEQLIEVKSEYMTFCPKCEYKLDNSYAAWRAKIANRDKGFTDYLSKVTVSSSALEGVKEQKQISREIGRGKAAKRMGWALGIALIAALIGGGIYWLTSRYAGRNDSIDALLNKEVWKISYYDDLGATLKFPHLLGKSGGFTADSLQQGDSLLQAQQQVILSAVNRQWGERGVISVSASRLDYKPDFGVDRDVATTQILQNMLDPESELDGEAEMRDRIRAFEFFKNDYSVPNIEARSLAGRYLRGPQAFEFRALMAQYEHTVWYFMVAYPRDAPEGILVAERFFRGILLDRRLQ